MFPRRLWLKSVLACGVVSAAASSLLSQERFDSNTADRNANRLPTSLEDQLRNGLRAVTPEQILYTRNVAQLVQQGVLPRAMVNLVYEWAIEKNSRVPLPYFQFALRELARRRRISVP